MSGSDPNAAPMSGMLDPSTMMLLGMGQGFAQAAMPSRMPVPFGAALGMAAGGMAQGAKDAQSMQLQQQQLQAAKINNQRAQALMSYFTPGQGGGNVQSGASSPFGVPPQQDANGNYLLSPASTKSLADLAMFSGQDRAAASLYGMLGNQAGGPGYAMAPNGTAFPVQGGAKDPSTLYSASNAEAAGKVGPALQEAGGKANIDLQKSYATPGEQPGGVYGTPGQTLGAPPQIGAPQSPQAASPDPFPAVAARINGYENSTGNPGATNGASTATGNGQFLDGTWPTVLRSVRPDLTAGKTDAQLMALRSDPDLALSATTAYARQNGAALAQNGIPVTPGNVYLSHVLGANGATSVLRANPSTPLSLVVPQAVIAANPQFQGKTTGDVRNWSDGQMQGVGQSQQQSSAPGISRTQLPGGAVQTTNTRPLMDEQYKNDMKSADGATDDIAHAQGQVVRLLAQRQAVQNLPTGALGNDRLAISNYVNTFMPSLSGTWAAKAAGLPDATLGQEFSKLALTSAGEQERGVLGGRGGFRAIELYKSANPNMELQPDANKQIINMQLVAQQADIDYARGLQGFVNKSGQAYVGGQDKYHPSSEFDQSWTSQRNPQVYSASIAALNGKAFADWSKGLTKEEGLRTLQIIGRIDPNATIPGDGGKPIPVSAFMPQQQASN